MRPAIARPTRSLTVIMFKAYNLTKNESVNMIVERETLAAILATARPYDIPNYLLDGPMRLIFSNYKFLFEFQLNRYLLEEEELNRLRGLDVLASLGD